MVIYDSSKKEYCSLEPLKNRHIKVYVCGPTVYDDAHLGHARSAIAFDLLRRTLNALGYKTTFMKNFTDIDDKIIKKMNETGKSLQEITSYYIQRYLEDMEALGVQRADIEPKATQNLDAMIDMIERLLQKECAYQTPNGDIYFDTSKDEKYCTLSHKCDEESMSRIEPNPDKKNPADFALWKRCKGEGDVCFDSPFGKGRPGWHIECSAMIDKHLAYHDTPFQIDIHAGGADLLFPHHENEAAQTRCACNQELAKYWMHNGFVTISGEKMSKSLGNSFFIKDALKVYDGEILRFYLLSTHYRSDLNFNEEDLLASKKRLDKLYRLKKRVYGVQASTPQKEFVDELLQALSQDLNISKTLAAIDQFIAYANEHLDNNPKDKAFKKQIVANIEYISKLLGIGHKDAYSYFHLGISEEEKQKIEELIEKRTTAKKEKNFQLADSIREELRSMGIAIMDTPQGTLWEKI
ncbi:cysteine--tRNA ligase [Nitratiruptor sp. SB155-2]|uniref:Cysteine--tRNA ligase n=1 Tax=Nitratiruptor sp. (strain SB155-2) TaxID=387092 RepID=SYC_NITSB|nr:cysteine--tRNA ligase [Nitratiruptor sp. SB155-2]A6Q401.1 RecName: Full=Cysteine--tRNA ligase; AltName: Full=Cysteinyl-tRNA synthetase; Short=CysRS [Nitratiruptor sp. SB155-2]BAF70210.1 cysteinyl-tRNA synthetase [Nitratiruptor sp. SB155-2]